MTYSDPVIAYDAIAPRFQALSDARRAYLDRVEQLVIREIPAGSSSLLDVGAGDGARALRIAKGAGLDNIVLLEPSAAMRRDWPGETRVWPIRAEHLSAKSETFDTITCLWNVLGHIFPQRTRIDVLRHCARLLSPEGRLFLDVNYRYNAAHYGILPTAFRILRDRTRPDEKNGDVTVRWNLEDSTHVTYGHVFTRSEFIRMTHSAGLIIEKEFTIDYSSGKIHRLRLLGNPLYVMRAAQRPKLRIPVESLHAAIR